MKTKGMRRFEIKDADKGLVEAVFATFNVVDSDGDVTIPGAFEDGLVVPISSYGHRSWQGALPVGKGAIRQTDTEAILDGRFFMDTPDGAATFSVIKALLEDELGDWSYGYDAMDYSFGEFEGQQVRFLRKQKVHEVSPVLIGAGVNTRTLAAKSGVGTKFSEEGESVLADLDAFLERAEEVVAMRRAKGKQLGMESTELLGQVAERLKRIDAVLNAPDPQQELERELLRFLART